MTVAIVTGAAGGIGSRIADRLVESQMTVHRWDLADAWSGRAVTGSIGIEITDEDAVLAAVAALPATPTVLVQCAAVLEVASVADCDVRAWNRSLAVNLTGTMLVARAFAARIAADGASGGAIVNLASINGVHVIPGAAAYTVSKAAVIRLSEAMALEWAGLGIRVNTVSPGFIDAGMNAPIVGNPVIRRSREEQIPLGRLGAADEIADAVTFLVGEAAAYVTGQHLVVDGGVGMTTFRGLVR